MADRVATMSETLARFGIDLNPALSRAQADSQRQSTQAEGGATASEKLKRLEDWGRRIGDDHIPPPSEFEAILRDAGISKTQRARIASRMHAALRSESGDEEADQPTVQDALAELRKAADGFTIPKI
jgi:hypothetical protein